MGAITVQDIRIDRIMGELGQGHSSEEGISPIVFLSHVGSQWILRTIGWLGRQSMLNEIMQPKRPNFVCNAPYPESPHAFHARRSRCPSRPGWISEYW